MHICIDTEGYDVCFAFHKATSDTLIGKFQTILNQIKSEGKLKDIYKTYGVEQPE